MLRPHTSKVVHVFALPHTKLALSIQRKYSFPAVLPGEHNEVEISKEGSSFCSAVSLLKIN